jgi:hypothetical protein
MWSMGFVVAQYLRGSNAEVKEEVVHPRFPFYQLPDELKIGVRPASSKTYGNSRYGHLSNYAIDIYEFFLQHAKERATGVTRVRL